VCSPAKEKWIDDEWVVGEFSGPGHLEMVFPIAQNEMVFLGHCSSSLVQDKVLERWDYMDTRAAGVTWTQEQLGLHGHKSSWGYMDTRAAG